MSRTIKRVRNLCILCSLVGMLAVGFLAFTAKHEAKADSLTVAAQLLASSAVGAQPGITPAPGYTTVGQGVWSVSGTTPVCLSTGGTTATSIPCALVWLQQSGGSVNALNVGTSAGTACTITAGTTAYLAVPCSNVNQLYVQTTAGTNAKVGYMYFVP